MTLRPQCGPCPWRDMATMPEYAIQAARDGHDDWHCHVRMGECDGPRHAGVLVDLEESGGEGLVSGRTPGDGPHGDRRPTP